MWSTKPPEVGVWSAPMQYQTEHLCGLFPFIAYRPSTQLHLLGIPVKRQILQRKVLRYSPHFCCLCVSVHVRA